MSTLLNPYISFPTCCGGGDFTATKQRVALAADKTTTCFCFEDLPCLTLTVANRCCGSFMAMASLTLTSGTASTIQYLRFVDGCTNKAAVSSYLGDEANIAKMVNFALTGTLCGQTLKVQWRTTSGTLTAKGTCDGFSQIEILEVSE